VTELRTIFDEDAELYDRARPAYPDPLFDDLMRLAGLRSGDRALEIGCGTGKATVPLARRGLRLTGVEPGENLARVAARNLSGFASADLEMGTFESWPLPAEPFDLVAAATCWHWLDPDMRLVKAAEALRPGGALAIIETVHVSDERGDDAFVRIQEHYERWDPSSAKSWGSGLPRISKLEPPEVDLDLFREPAFRAFPWVGTFTAGEYLDLLSSFSGHRAMRPANRARLFDGIAGVIAELGGRIRKHHAFTLTVARRR
jgi:SAM-dependent methyltransferase